MSGPYDHQYGQQQGYPQGGYPDQQQVGYGYPQGYGQGYPPQQGGYPPQQGYQPSPSPQPGQYGQYGQQQPPYQGYGGEQYGPPAGYGQNFGPPQHGGFQHGQAGGQFGQYDASHPQGQPGYYGGSASGGGGEAQSYHQGHPNQGTYGQGAQPPPPQVYDANGQPHQFAPQSSDKNAPNYDPKAPPMSEGERGLMGSIGGAAAGHYLGKNSGHGLLGTIGGALMGNFMEDKLKGKGKHGKKHGGSSHHGSSWGGKW